MKVAYLNKKFIPLEKTKISVLDRGFLYGDGIFETMRSYDGVIFRLEEHLKRLFTGLKILRINPRIGAQNLRQAIYKTLDKNRLKDAYIKVIITRGVSGGLLLPSGKQEPTIAVYVFPFNPPTKRMYEKGVSICISGMRKNETSLISGLKALNYLNNVLSRVEANDKNCYDAIHLNTQGSITEASSSNIFIVKKDRLFTPHLATGVLPGITREEAINLTKKFLNQNVYEKRIKPRALFGASEIFLTNTLVEILPVTKINGKNVGRGMPGPLTKTIMTLYKESVGRYYLYGR